MLNGPETLSELQPHPGVSGLAIGVFDGVHLGHQAVVRSLAGSVAALTFEPHPLAVIAPERVPARLTSLEQRVKYLRAIGTVAVVAVKFDAALRGLSSSAFVAELLRIFPDLKQIATVEAIFLYNAAQRDEMLPRKPLPDPEAEQKRREPLEGIFPGAVRPAPNEKK